jgi:hypothetical protein
VFYAAPRSGVVVEHLCDPVAHSWFALASIVVGVMGGKSFAAIAPEPADFHITRIWYGARRHF